MKKNIAIIITIYFAAMFLIYAGIFRNFNNPEVVAQYYFECLKNREGYLTYQISSPEFFDQDRLGKIFNKFQMKNMRRIVTELIDKNSAQAIVKATFFYSNKEKTQANINLKRTKSRWLITNITFPH